MNFSLCKQLVQNMQKVSEFSLPAARLREYSEGELILLPFSMYFVILKFNFNTHVYSFAAQFKE